MKVSLLALLAFLQAAWAISQGTPPECNVFNGAGLPVNYGCEQFGLRNGAISRLNCTEAAPGIMPWALRPPLLTAANSPTSAYTLRTGDGANPAADPTSYKPGEILVLYLRVRSYDMKFRGLLGNARVVADLTKRAGDWEQPDPELYTSPWTVGNTCGGGVSHSSARIKPYLSKLYWRAPPAGTGTVRFEMLIKQGDANTGAFFYASNQRDGMLTLTESTAPLVPRSIYHAPPGVTCTAHCASLGAACDQVGHNALAATSPTGLQNFQSAVLPWHTCDHLMATCGDNSDPVRLPVTNDCTYIDSNLCTAPATASSTCEAAGDASVGRLCSCKPDPCNPSPCHPVGGVCSVDTLVPLSEDAWKCTCVQGFSGPRCTILQPTCGATGNPNFPCVNGGVCTVPMGATEVRCDCTGTVPDGAYTGTTCEIPPPCTINPCRSVDPLATCANVENPPRNFTARCQCSTGYSGPDCTVIDGCALRAVAGQQCLNGGICADNPNDNDPSTSSCNCVGIGFTGLRCETDLDECVFGTNPCEHGQCVNQIGTFNCTCDPTWTGTLCNIPEPLQWCAAPGPCGGNALSCIECPGSPTCQPSDIPAGLSSHYKCNCRPGWSGKQCDILVDFCATTPCSNGATCANTPGNASTGTCTCPRGFTGALCNQDVNECTNNPCQNGGACINLVGTFSCDCSAVNFIGPLCADAPGTNITNWCASNPCSVVGTDPSGCVECPADGSCGPQDIPNGLTTSFRCPCRPGYTGKRCSDQPFCASNPCRNGATCVPSALNALNGSCSCTAGWEGQFCERDRDDCNPNPCLNGGTCTDRLGSYTCACVRQNNIDWTGQRCEVDPTVPPVPPSWCTPVSPCVNSVACHECPATTVTGGPVRSQSCTTQTDFFCECQPGFEGRQCNLVTDTCASNPCQNGGICTVDLSPGNVNGYTCNCPAGYDGDRCERDINDCVGSPCANGGQCRDGVNSFTCTCPAGRCSGATCSQCIRPALQCTVNEDCRATESDPDSAAATKDATCKQGVCSTIIPCTSQTDCPIHYTCTGQGIAANAGIQFCVQRQGKPAGAACKEGSECESLSCADSVCAEADGASSLSLF